MIISMLNDGKIAITIEDRDEAIDLYTALNRQYQKYHPRDDAYDINEISTESWPKTITEDELDDNPNTGFVMWSDDFWEIIRECGAIMATLKPGEQMQV